MEVGRIIVWPQGESACCLPRQQCLVESRPIKQIMQGPYGCHMAACLQLYIRTGYLFIWKWWMLLLLYVVVYVGVESRSQGKWGLSFGPGEGCRRWTEHAEGFLFRAGVCRVVMSLEGTEAATMGWASGVFTTMTANDRMLWLTYFKSVARSREMR